MNDQPLSTCLYPQVLLFVYRVFQKSGDILLRLGSICYWVLHVIITKTLIPYWGIYRIVSACAVWWTTLTRILSLQYPAIAVFYWRNLFKNNIRCLQGHTNLLCRRCLWLFVGINQQQIQLLTFIYWSQYHSERGQVDVLTRGHVSRTRHENICNLQNLWKSWSLSFEVHIRV